jgi:hypothetical protein
VDVAPAMAGSGPGEEGEQRAHDQDRLQSLAQHEHERLEEQVQR